MDHPTKNCHSQLLVGLGNPGDRYHDTRHNIGFMAVDYFVSKADLLFSHSDEFYGDVARLQKGEHDFWLLKPLTYMNMSGKSVLAAVEMLRCPPPCLVVVHDDLDLEFGRIKIAVNRGAGGHNGLRSIIEELQSKDFVRVRCGIGRPCDGDSVVDYVLAPFTEKEREQLPAVLEKIYAATKLIIEKGVVHAMNSVNQDIGLSPC